MVTAFEFSRPMTSRHVLDCNTRGLARRFAATTDLHPWGRLYLAALAINPEDLEDQAVFAPLLRTYHLAAAMVPFVLFCRGPRGRADVLWWTTAALVLATLTLRQRNLLGEPLWRVLDGGAMLHVALVLLVAWSVRDARPERGDTP